MATLYLGGLLLVNVWAEKCHDAENYDNLVGAPRGLASIVPDPGPASSSGTDSARPMPLCPDVTNCVLVAIADADAAPSLEDHHDQAEQSPVPEWESITSRDSHDAAMIGHLAKSICAIAGGAALGSKS
eukprot:CAMPEP_0117468310 /NCGR_PEP_ID=MMETSP0784-20121206/6111_1 /TAXON_ID=39447 /ORGANISM="" /LENGTH=128 /DNA_ID=CAMNT_0005262317 /DNA_START=560 /DNA_END=946 /DNA_ORIENTATION=-